MIINYKKILFSLFLISLFLIGSKTFGATYNFSQNLTIGSSGADVTALQQILVNGGYLTMPAGVVMGNFANLTKLAVIKYQSANQINQTGTVGPITRASLKNIDLGNTKSTSASNQIIIMPAIDKPDSVAPTITLEADPKQVIIGQPTTFTWKSDNVVDECKITSKDSSGKVLSGIIESSGVKSSGPINKDTTYTIVCYNKYGIPGTKSILVEAIDPAKIIEQKNTRIQAASISSIIPSSGNRGSAVVIKGTGFLSTNDIYFDGAKIDSNLILSQSSSSISFIIPEYKTCLSAYCPAPAFDTIVETGGAKIIQVSNLNGFSNDFSFTLPSKKITIPGATVVKQYTPPKLAITSITPTSGNRGDVVTILGISFSSDSIVFFGGYKVADNLILSKNSTSISFVVPPYQMGCTEPDYEVCPRLPMPGNGLIIETGGIRSIYVMNTSTKATSTALQFTLPSKKITY